MIFIADGTLGKLVKYLRMLGYDAICYKQNSNDALIRVAEEQGRLLLTRKAKLKGRATGKGIFLITQNNSKKQLEEVINYYHLYPDTDFLFTRCLVCNEELTAIPKEDAEGKVPEYILKSHVTFFLCHVCCNEELTAIPKEDAEGKVPEYILKSHVTFFLCHVCKRIFWPGSHYERMMKGFIHSTCQRH